MRDDDRPTRITRVDEPRTHRQRQAARTHGLLAKARSCDGERRFRLEQEVAILNMDVARSVAIRYWNRGEPEDDLAQVAYVGLMKAIRGYNPYRGKDFYSYAIPTITGEVKRHFRDESWTVKTPRRIQELQRGITKAAAELCQTLARMPNPAELAERLGASREEVIEALSASGCFAPASIDDRGPTAGDHAFVDRLGAEDDDLERAEIRVVLEPLVHQLAVPDRRVLELRFVREWTQSQIAADLGVTQMQVSRMLSRILRDLRRQLTAA